MFKAIFFSSNYMINIADSICLVILCRSILSLRNIGGKDFNNKMFRWPDLLMGIFYNFTFIIKLLTNVPTTGIYYIVDLLLIFVLLLLGMKLLYSSNYFYILYCILTFLPIVKLSRFFTSSLLSMYTLALSPLTDSLLQTLSYDRINLYLFLTTWGHTVFSYMVYFTVTIFTTMKIRSLVFPNKLRFRKGETSFLLYPGLSCIIIGTVFQYVILIYNQELEVYELIYDQIPSLVFLIPLSIISLLANMIIQLKLFLNLSELHKQEKNTAAMEIQLAQTRQHLYDVEKLYDDIRALKHDMNNHIAHMQGLVDAHQLDALQTYFISVTDTVNSLDFKYSTGNPVTDVILNQKYKNLAKNHIQCDIQFQFPAYLTIDSFSIAIILSNLLDNAVESSLSYFQLKGYAKGHLFLIETENDYDGSQLPVYDNGLPLTTKENKDEHGIGLKSIQKCIEKYHGTFEISTDNHIFKMLIMMKGK